MTITAQKSVSRGRKMAAISYVISFRSIRNRLGCAKKALLGESGATMVEFAFATTILFALVFGIIQISMALYSYHFTADAAREATRWAIVRGSLSCTNTPGLNK